MTAQEMMATEERLLTEMAARYGALITKGNETMITIRKHRIIGQKRAADIRQRKMTVSMLIVSVLWHDNQAAKPRLPAR